MVLLVFPNFSSLTTGEMLLFLCSIVFATAAGITAFLYVNSGNMQTFKRTYSVSSTLPVVMSDGRMLNTKEDLEAHLELLEHKLVEKADKLELSKGKINDTKVSIDKLAATQLQVKKYYVKLKEEINRSEDEFRSIQKQIDDYRAKRFELEKSQKKSEKLCLNILKHSQSHITACEENSLSPSEQCSYRPLDGKVEKTLENSKRTDSSSKTSLRGSALQKSPSASASLNKLDITMNHLKASVSDLKQVFNATAKLTEENDPYKKRNSLVPPQKPGDVKLSKNSFPIPVKSQSSVKSATLRIENFDQPGLPVNSYKAMYEPESRDAKFLNHKNIKKF